MSRGTGREEEFVYNAGSYDSPKGVYLNLIQNGNGTWTVTQPNGTNYEFNVAGVLTEISDRNGNAITFAYSATPEAIYSYPLYPRTTPVTSATVVGYEYQLTTITDTVGRDIDFTYNTDGKLDKITDYSGREVSFSYDANTGDLLTITKPATTQYPTGVTKTFEYDTNHNLETITDAKSQTFVTNYFDSEGRVYQQDLGTGSFLFSYGVGETTITDRNGYDITFDYDGDANMTSFEVFTDGLRVGEPASYITTQTRDAEGNLASVTYPEGNGVKYVYDVTNTDRRARGNLLQVRQKADMAVADDNNADLITTITYESTYNQIKTLTDPKGNVYTVTYDYELNPIDPKYATKGNAVKVELPTVNSQTPTWEYTYNAYGQITEVEDPNGNITQYTYHASTGYLNQVKRDPAGINAVTTVTYDSIGNIDTITDGESRVTDYDFNELNWLIQVTNDLGYVTKLTHDKNGNVTKVERQVNDAATAWQDVDFTYDILNNLKTVTD
ncbi:MAG: hypothetical protein K8I00_02795, partial [Candidatus Omnitrophica bacterium]|nr:hypothetical protein [Candidatus Omnitrophota bacterium]